MQVAEKIAEVLDISLDYLCDRTDNPDLHKLGNPEHLVVLPSENLRVTKPLVDTFVEFLKYKYNIK